MSYPTPLLLLVASAAAQASSTGNCVTGRMTFDPLRMYALGFDGAIPDLDAAKYDFTIDYGAVNTRVLDPIGVTTTLARTGNFGDGARISTVRYMQYGKLTARLKAAAVGGLVTTFITMSKSKVHRVKTGRD